MAFYAVRVGRFPGTYHTWDECKAQVNGYPRAAYKKFNSRSEAASFIADGSSSHNVISQSIRGTQNHVSFKAKHSHGRCHTSSSHAGRDYGYRTRETRSSGPVVHTDGCCFNNGRRRAVGGIGVYWGPNHPLNISEPLDVPKPTNQKAEVRAAYRALKTAIDSGLDCIELRTDSSYTIKSMTEWIKRWERNGWKTADNRDVLNKGELMRLSELCQQINVTWVQVAGHAGIHGNEEADRLAREGALSR